MTVTPTPSRPRDVAGRRVADRHGPSAATRRLPFEKLPSWIEPWISAGTAPYPRHVRRRLRIMNVVAYLVAFFTLIYALQYAVMGLSKYWMMVLINLAIVPIALMVPYLHRYNEILGGVVLIIAEFIALFAITALLGRASGVHLQYFACAAAPFFVLGVNRARLAFLLVGIALVLHVLAWIFLPLMEGILTIDPSVQKSAYVTAVFTTMGLVAVTIFYAFRWGENAREQADMLLANALPGTIIERLKDNPDQRIADRHEVASVLFADLVGFTPLSRGLEPEELVAMLNEIFLELDDVALRHGIEKIKTIGDSYMAVSGAPIHRDDHAERMADFAMEIRDVIRNAATRHGHDIDVRIGIAAGPILAGIIGAQKFSYDVWGDTVNVASRMESSAHNGTIQVNEAFRDLLKGKYIFEDQGTNEVKGLGPTQTWRLIEAQDR